MCPDEKGIETMVSRNFSWCPMPDALVTSFRDRLRQGSEPALLAELDAAVRARREQRGGHTDWGLFCEEAGLMPLAFREFQLALRDNPHDAVAAFRLAHHYRERGDTGRAARLLEGLLAASPARDDWLTLYADILRQDNALPRLRAALQQAIAAGLPTARARVLEQGETGPEQEPEEPAEEWTPTDADCMRFLALFAGREDLHARQWVNKAGEAGYSPVQEPLTAAVVRQHLLGSYTVGVYPIRLDGACTFLAVDLDISKHALELARREPARARALRDMLRREAARLLDVLRGLGLEPLFENSGYKGRHYWVFLEQPEPAEVLHLLGRLLLSWQSPQVPDGLHLEFFPKQAGRGGKGLGNLIKLPLGIHRRTGRRALLLDSTGQPLPRPLAALRGVARLSRQQLHTIIDRLKQLAAAQPRPPATGPGLAAEPAVPDRTGPPPPAPAPAWTEADFNADPRLKHLLEHCPVLAELKRTVDEHRQLSHEEQLVLIHTLGHVEGGPQAVNYLFARCADVGPEKFLKDRLKGNPVSCPSIRKKIGHITRRVPCNCPFDFAPDRYPTPVLHLLTLANPLPPPPAWGGDAQTLARRFAASAQRLAEVQRDHDELERALFTVLRSAPDRTVSCPGGRYRLIDKDGVEEMLWEKDVSTEDRLVKDEPQMNTDEHG
jgi:hypothetical protein